MNRIIMKIGELYRGIKFAFQRMFRGFDDTAYWNLDYYLAGIILPALRFYKEEGQGLPYNFEKGRTCTENEWDEILDRMIKAFKYIWEEHSGEDPFMVYTHQKAVEEGLELFAKYYNYLWE